ncbi:MAG: alkaline phosphatase family protein [Candidatus Kariarchaeaceae archaeon]
MNVKKLVSVILIISCFFMLGTTPQSQASVTAVEGVQPGKLAFIIVMDGVRRDFFNETILPNVFEKLVPNGVLFTNATTPSPAITTVSHVAMITGSYPNITGAVATSTYNSTAYHLDGSLSRVNFGSSTSIPSETLLTHADDVLTLMIVGKNKLSNMKKDLNEAKGSYFKVLPGEYQETTIMDEGEEKRVDKYSAEFPVELRYQQDSWIINDTMNQLLAYKDQIKNGRDTLVILNLAAPDWAGHAHGCTPDEYHQNSSIYRSMINDIDVQLNRLFTFLEDNELDEYSSFFMTADHGFHNVLPGSTGYRPILSSTMSTAFDVAMNTTYFDEDFDNDGVADNNSYHDLYIVATAENTLHLYLRYPERTMKTALTYLHQYSVAHDFGGTPIFSRLWVRDEFTDEVNDTSLYNGTLSDIGMNTFTAGDIVIEYKAEVEYAGKTYPGFKPEFPESLGDHGVMEDTAVPLLMSGIGFKNNITENNPSSVTDIAPTVARLLGIKKPVESNGKVWEEYFVDEGSLSEIQLESLYLDEDEPTTITIEYETFSTGPYKIQYYILNKEFSIVLQGNESVSTGSGTVTFDFEGGAFEESPYYVVAQVLNSSDQLLDQSQDFLIIQTSYTPEFPIVWVITGAVLILVVVLTLGIGRQIKKKNI